MCVAHHHDCRRLLAVGLSSRQRCKRFHRTRTCTLTLAKGQGHAHTAATANAATTGPNLSLRLHRQRKARAAPAEHGDPDIIARGRVQNCAACRAQHHKWHQQSSRAESEGTITLCCDTPPPPTTPPFPSAAAVTGKANTDTQRQHVASNASASGRSGQKQ